MARYKLLENSTGIWGVKDTEDGGLIPFDEDNRHYQEYLLWVADGNTADPANS
tara:strand:+ start:1306 stop:1464 length:159 start_codon:yes stop_codon:yes gene_type:complete